MMDMTSTRIKQVVMYYAVSEKLEQLYIDQKITQEQMRKAKGYIIKKYSLQSEIFDSFLN